MSGFVTPTEAAVIANDYALILGIFYREISLRSFVQTLNDTIESIGSVVIITSIASFFVWMVTREGLPMLI